MIIHLYVQTLLFNLKTKTMKKLVMIISMAIATMGFAFGQEDRPGTGTGTGTGTDVQTGGQNKQQKKINKEELPRSINNAFSTGEYQEWALEDAYSVTTTPDGERAAYMVTAKKEEKVNLYFDANGKLIKKEDRSKEMNKKKGQEDIN